MDSLQIVCLGVIIALSTVLLLSKLSLRRTVIRKYKISNSSEEAKKEMDNWFGNKWWVSALHFLLKLLISVSFSLIILSIFSKLFELNIFIILVLFVAFFLTFLIFVETVDVVAMKKISIAIKIEKDFNLEEIIIGIVKEYGIMFSFILLAQIVILSFGDLGDLNPLNKFLISVLRTISLVLLTLSFSIIIPLIITLFSKAKRIENFEIETFVAQSLPIEIRRKPRVYLTQDENASAIVSDLLFRRIFISKKLLEICSKEEMNAILLHEIAHLKLKHLIKQLSVNILIFLLLSLFSGLLASRLMDDYIAKNIGEGFLDILPIISSILSIIAFLFLFYDIFLGRAGRSRKHEQEADEWVVRNGINPQIFISALRKIHSDNELPSTSGKFEEKFSTHPTLENRIKYINEFAESKIPVSAPSERF